nr:MAG TPA: hypothetical protein [Caudoviricetes sp.]
MSLFINYTFLYLFTLLLKCVIPFFPYSLIYFLFSNYTFVQFFLSFLFSLFFFFLSFYILLL